MRPLKLRAYDLDKKEMFDVYQIQFQDNGITVRKRGSLHKSENAPKNVVLMLSTTLHDRHGKEIWEGDKVRFLRKQGYWSHDKGDVEVVKYITDPQAQYCGFGFSALHPLTSRKAKKIEVVGNIFEGGE